ncbi:hypothetical protein NM208_g3066 [Fusarium decemcellulare]|uniref:Uncharacterized protein n=1 Tax=Fusarium decemcellulare TaxID=57161 RepID=A0ACC1SQI8_9HYPO|nr:hypothetical protein NM208_g3066 [Fusarium decemcellulare]
MVVTGILAAILIPLAVVLKCILDFSQSSLSSLPGPWHTKFTGVGLLYARAAGISREHMRQLHKRYGPVVRVGPKEVSVNSLDGYYKIHGVGSRCTKAPVFDKIRFRHSPMLFTMRDPQMHAQRKRVLGRSFAAVRPEQETKIRRLAQRAVSQIKKEAEGGKADVYKWWRCLAVDVVSEMAFGKSFELLESGGQDSPVFRALESAGQSVVLQAVLPASLLSLVKWSPVDWLREAGRCTEVMFNRMMVALDELRLSPNTHSSMLGHMMSATEKEKQGVLSDEEMGSEAAMMIVAGSDSTAATLTYATWEVLRRPDLRQQLEDEVAALPPDFTARDVEALPLLNRVLEEVLRLYNPAAALVERLAPPSGISIHGWDIPGGTMIYTQSWLISRLEEIFPSPDTLVAPAPVQPTNG